MTKKTWQAKKKMDFIYQKESNLDEENNFTIEIFEKTTQKRKNLLVEMNNFYQAQI